MKRAVTIIGVIGVTALITYLWIARNDSDARTQRLEKALADAEGRVSQLQGDIENANQRLARLTELRASRLAPLHARSGGSMAGQSSTGGTDGLNAGISQGSTVALDGQLQQAFPTPAPATILGNPAQGVPYVAARGTSNWVNIQGTSSIHDWQVHGSLIGGNVRFGPGFPTTLGMEPDPRASNASVSVFIPVQSLKSVEKSGALYSDAMDQVMYAKLRGEKYPRITFMLDSLDFLDSARHGDSAFPYLATGSLSLAGVTNAITMRVSLEPQSDGRIRLTGLAHLKMSEFGISPPGPTDGPVPISVGDGIRVSFGWTVKPKDNLQAER